MTSSTSRSILRPFAASALVALLTLAGVFFIVGHAVHASDRRDLHRLQDALCGLVVPIGTAPKSATTTNLGHTIIVAAGHSSQVIQCPGGKR